jgi:hypothetical protein
VLYVVLTGCAKAALQANKISRKPQKGTKGLLSLKFMVRHMKTVNDLIFPCVDNYANQRKRETCLLKPGTKNPKKNIIYKKSRAKVKISFCPAFLRAC